MFEQKHFSIKEYLNGIYQGDILENNVREGLGVYLWDSGEFYYGEWSRDLIEGNGVLYFPYGGYIRGTFKKNRIHGFGVLCFPNGDIYKGEWKNGKLDGKCYKYFLEKNSWLLCKYKDGRYQSLFEKGRGNPDMAEFNENMLENLETLSEKYNSRKYIDIGYNYKFITFPDNGKFIGIMKNELPEGIGMFHYTDGKIDEGFYKNGLLDGFGRLNFHNGDIYDGMMKNGLFEGYGIFYKKSSNKWVYGLFSENKCTNILESGKNKPIEIMGIDFIIFLFIFLEIVKADQHKTSSYFINNTTSCQTFEIPLFSENKTFFHKSHSQGVLKNSVAPKNTKTNSLKTNNNKKNDDFAHLTQKKAKPPKKNIGFNTEKICLNSQGTQTFPDKIMIDSWTQTPSDSKNKEFEATVESNLSNAQKTEYSILSHNKEETQKTFHEMSSLASEQDYNEKKKLTKFEIENLFKSVKNMVNGIKDKDTKTINNNSQTSINLSQRFDIRNLKESTDLLIQKLENIKKSQADVLLKQSSLQSSDFMLSKSESAFPNFDANLNNTNNNISQKPSNMIESRFLESYCFNSQTNANQQNNDDFNISKSIDFFEKILNSQLLSNILATKESKLSNNIALSTIENIEQNQDNENENELFQSKVMSSYKNLPQQNSEFSNVPLLLIENQKQTENKDKILIFDQEQDKHNQEKMAKYSSGIEKIEEKAEETNFSPNNKNNNLENSNSEEMRKVLQENNCETIKNLSKMQINLPFLKETKKKSNEINKNAKDRENNKRHSSLGENHQ